MIRLIANILTEEGARHELKDIKQDSLSFFSTALQLLSKKSPVQSEECILNIVACFTNFLFYDI